MLKDLFALATVTGVVRRILVCPFFEGPLQLDGMGAVATPLPGRLKISFPVAVSLMFV